ncbi:MAG TPA: VWA domain-containing protein [Thermoanaerobaculia bacterium]
MIRRRAFAAALALLLPAAVPRAAAAQPPAPEGFHEETSVVVVEVPVQVVKDGQPVRGLTAASFEVWDGKVRRPITSFEVVDLAAVAAGPGGRPARVPPAARRNFLLLFDLAFSSHRSLERAEVAARDLLARGLHQQDLVGLALYTAERGVVLPVGFTSDRRQVERVLDTIALLLRRDVEAAARLRREAETRRERDPLGLTAGDVRAVVGSIGSLAGVEISAAGEAMGWISDGGEGRGAGMLAETLAEMDAITTPFITQARRSQIRSLSQDFSAVARATRDVQGRKYLVFFSDGFDDAMMLGDSFERRSLEGPGQLFGNVETLNDLNRMLEEFRRAGWAIHTVEAFGLGTGGGATGIGTEGLFYLAEETGGTFYQNRNDLAAAMAAMLEASSLTYVLSFAADEVPADGAFRKLRVELKGAPRGARVVHRAGYYAPLPLAQQRGAERRFAAADLVVAGEAHSEIPVAILATPFQGAGEGERGYVPVVVEIDAAALAAERTAEGVGLELYGYAFDGAGQVQDFFAQQLQLDAARSAALGAGALRFVADLRLPPGEHELRLLLRGAASGRTTLAVVPLAVPNPLRIAKRLLPPFFVAAEEGTLTLREAGTEAQEAEYPFRLGTQPFVPAPRPRLAADEETRLVLSAYHLVDGDLRVSGRVLAADGTPVAGGVLTGVGRLKGEGDLARVLATFRPEGLAPGDYRLEVTLAEPGGAAVKATAPFAVVAQARRDG